MHGPVRSPGPPTFRYAFSPVRGITGTGYDDYPQIWGNPLFSIKLNFGNQSGVSEIMLRHFLLFAVFSAVALAQPPPARQFLVRIEPVRQGFTLQSVTEEEKPVLAQHGAYLKSLLAKGTLTFAGQAFDPKGLFGIVVINAPDAESAQAIMEGDPLIKAKIFRGECIPFRTVLERGTAPQP
jgi:uncharacterized protein